jgi:hypothetical protein
VEAVRLMLKKRWKNISNQNRPIFLFWLLFLFADISTKKGPEDDYSAVDRHAVLLVYLALVN